MANISVRSLRINGAAMPTPALNGVTITRNKIWSSDTGRTASGVMVGTLIAVKTKLVIKWPPLAEEQVARIEAAVSDPSAPFATLEYTDMTGTVVWMDVYFGDPSYTQYSWSNGLRYVQDVTVDAIEK